MESGSAVVQKEEGKKKYQIYVEEYVLSYLRREADSLELSEIYFYGLRQDEGRKIFVYGAGRDKGIEAFAKYVPLSELICRLTQAGPVFMVREPSGECKVSSFQVFYENNEAMQSYLLEWTGSTEKNRHTKKEDRQDIQPPVLVAVEDKTKKEVHGAISVQLCLILVLLTAIVITSTDSFDKMKQLGQSAKEVFFAIENQEAEEDEEDFENVEKRNEIVVERDVAAESETAEEISDHEGGMPEKVKEQEKEQEAESEKEKGAELEKAEGDGEAADKESEPQEGLLQSVKDESAEKSAEQEENQDSQEEEKSSELEAEPEEGEEALSRSVTRYYEVEQGDTLYTISQKIYGDFSRVEKICEVNQITDPDRIRSGQRIILP